MTYTVVTGDIFFNLIGLYFDLLNGLNISKSLS